MAKQSRISRRSFLKFSGAALAAAVGGTLWRAIDQGVFAVGQGPAYEPWQNWDQTEDDYRAMVQAATLAPNPHNTQPWLFQVSENQIDLHADPARNLGSVDPYRREMYLGLGCALENMRLAALSRGWKPDIRLMPPSNKDTHTASILLSTGNRTISPLYTAIPKRHTNRAAYAPQQLPADVFTEMATLKPEKLRLFWLNEEPARSGFGSLNIQATEAFIADAEQSADSGCWFRHNWDEIQSSRDGITLDAQGNPALITTMGKILPPLSQEQNDQYWLQAIHTQVESAPAFGLIAIPERRDKATLLEAGMLYQRLHLWAITAGLAMQPLNQVVERIDREISLGEASTMDASLHALTDSSGWQVVMPFRIGYPTIEAQPSPRRSVEMVLIYDN
jgi:hypothetical protein